MAVFHKNSLSFHVLRAYDSAMKHTKAFADIARRAAAARVTMNEVLDRAGVKRITYWRAAKGHSKRQDTIIKVLRAAEAALDDYEAEAINHEGA